MNTWEIVLLVLAAWLCLSAVACALWVCAIELARSRGRRRRHGGYLRPDVYARMKDGGRRTRGTDITARISSYSPPGSRLAVRERLVAPVLPSRPTVLGSSGGATVDHGASGARLHSADSGSAVPPPWPQPWDAA